MNEYIVLYEVNAGTPPNDHGFQTLQRVWAANPDDAAKTVDLAYLRYALDFAPGALPRIVGVMLVKPEGANEPRL